MIAIFIAAQRAGKPGRMATGVVGGSVLFTAKDAKRAKFTAGFFSESFAPFALFAIQIMSLLPVLQRALGVLCWIASDEDATPAFLHPAPGVVAERVGIS